MAEATLSSAERHASTMNDLIAIKRKETLREVLEYVNEIEVEDTPGHGVEMLIVAGLKVKLDKMIKEV